MNRGKIVSMYAGLYMFKLSKPLYYYIVVKCHLGFCQRDVIIDVMLFNAYILREIYHRVPDKLDAFEDTVILITKHRPYC